MRVALAVDKAIPQLVFHLSYPSHKTPQLCLLPLFLFVLLYRPKGRLIATPMHVWRPLAGDRDRQDRISRSQDEDRGWRRKEQRVDYKVMRRGDTTAKREE